MATQRTLFPSASFFLEGCFSCQRAIECLMNIRRALYSLDAQFLFVSTLYPLLKGTTTAVTPASSFQRLNVAYGTSNA